MRTLLASLDTEEAHEIVCQAYTFGYPLVLTDTARQLMTDVDRPDHERAPLNQFAHAATPFDTHSPDANPDVLRSAAWLSVGKEPIVLTVPYLAWRHYSIQLTDAWTNVVASLGSRTSSTAGHIAVLGPRWPGAIVAPIRSISSRTNLVRLVVRIETEGAHDYAAVNTLQQGLRLTPLSAWSHAPQPARHPAIAHHEPSLLRPPEAVARMEGAVFFERLNALMTDNPPSSEDASPLHRFAAIGVGPGLRFDVQDDAYATKQVDASAHTALARIVVEAQRSAGRLANGWWIPSRADRRDRYMQRAARAHVDLDALLHEDLVSLHTNVDAHGKLLSGAHRYVLRFAEGQLPPVRGFWSIALYNVRHNVVDNPPQRHMIGSRNALARGSDGRIVLHIQHASPGAASESNWLPTPPRDHFTLIMRLYWPTSTIVEGAWVPPSVERI